MREPQPENRFAARAVPEGVLSRYGVTLLISAASLFGMDRCDLLREPIVSLKRTLLVAFPASFAATVVDSMR